MITPAGMASIQRRIQELMNERPEVIEAVAIAREFGDLSENAEYKAARERQRHIDGEIDYLRLRAARLKVVDPAGIPKDKVRFGSICHTRDLDNGEEIVFQVVGVDELNYFTNDKIQPVSVLSPIGKALLGRQAQEVALVQAPIGNRELRILKIS